MLAACPICLETISEPCWRWQCLHAVHMQCLAAGAEHNNGLPCPVCRTKADQMEVLVFRSQCLELGISLAEANRSWNGPSSASSNNAPLPLQHIIPRCCQRVVCVQDPQSPTNNEFVMIDDDRMEWFPILERAAWSLGWKCLMCDAELKEADVSEQIRRMSTNRPYCPVHGDRVIEWSHGSCSWVCAQGPMDEVPTVDERCARVLIVEDVEDSPVTDTEIQTENDGRAITEIDTDGEEKDLDDAMQILERIAQDSEVFSELSILERIARGAA